MGNGTSTTLREFAHERQRVSQSEYDKYYYNYDAFGRKTEESVMLEKRKNGAHRFDRYRAVNDGLCL